MEFHVSSKPVIGDNIIFPSSSTQNAELKAISDNEYAKTVAEVRNKFV